MTPAETGEGGGGATEFHTSVDDGNFSLLALNSEHDEFSQSLAEVDEVARPCVNLFTG